MIGRRARHLTGVDPIEQRGPVQPTRSPLWQVLVLLLFAAQPTFAIESVDLPLDHWAYEMLERFEVRAGLTRTGLETRPLRRGQVARLVRQLLDGAARADWTPTRIETAQLEMLQEEFSAELVAQGSAVPVLDRAYHHWTGTDWEFQLQFFAIQEASHANMDRTSDFAQTDLRLAFEPQAGLVLRRDFAGWARVSLIRRTSDGVLRNSTDPAAGEAEYVFDTRDRVSFTRRVEPYVRYLRGPVMVDLGRERLRWGPGRHNGMLLLNETPPLDLLRLELDFGWIRFAHVAGQLRPAQLEDDDPALVEKYMAAHRLVLQVHRRFLIGVAESVVYGDRGLDLTYLNPINVFYVAQANVGDHDNALGSVDAKLVLPNLELYGELLVDDLNLRRGLDHFGNKLGVLGGFLWLRPFGASDWDLDGEWSWASQFTYTHQIPINRYEHYGSTLGSRTGPDSDLWVAGLRRRFSRGWSARMFYALERHGAGGLATDQDERPDDSQDYLSGTVESVHQPGLEIRYQGLRNVELFVDTRYLHVTNPANDATRAALDQMAVRALARVEF